MDMPTKTARTPWPGGTSEWAISACGGQDG